MKQPLALPRSLPATVLAVVLGMFGLPLNAPAAPPDLTAGGIPGDTISFNMGPTGARGWVYHVRENSSLSRQILIKSVTAGTPAAGILAPDDVILGASGTGANPVSFTSDARKALANAINDAEARDPATLSLLRWRGGTTTTVTLTLQTMGAYSATAPYNCPKSALILQRGLQAIMSGETAGRYSFGTISLLAANNPTDPANAARMTRAQNEARALVPSAAVRAQMMADTRDATSMITWERGHTLIVLAEYFLLTGDTQVLPGIEAYAVNIAKNSSLFGTMGHIFADKNPDGSANGPMGGVYGPVNSAGMPCFLGLLLARECGLTNPEITPGIERMSRFHGYYFGRGSIPYGEHEAEWSTHDNNGKSGLAALCFTLQSNRVAEGKFFAKMASASGSVRGSGHTGAFFNYVWAPLGAACGGEEAVISHSSRIRWMLDLNRRWDGRFDYDCLTGEGPNSGSQYNDFRMSTAALLTYALPLRQLRITGRNHDPARWLTPADIAEAAAVDGYVADSSRTTSQLVADLGSWSPMVQRRAADQLATRSIDTATLNQLTALANDPNGKSRIGACLTLGKISNSGTANARAATLAALLTDPQNHVRFMAAEAMRYLPQTAKMTQLNAVLAAAASTAKPLLPFDEEDPLHFAHGRIAMLLFYSGNAYGPKGMIWGTGINGVDRRLLYPAVRAVAANPIGMCRSTLQQTYTNLTAADVNALGGAIVDSVRFRTPSDKMFSAGVRTGGLIALEKYKIAEGVPLSLIYMVDDGRGDAYKDGLGILKKYAGGCTTVAPDPDVIGFCQSLLGGSQSAAALEVLNAIAADPNPAPLTPFKSIQSATADSSSLNLPANQTTLRATASDLAGGDSVFAWRKVHGVGNVTFTPNGTATAKDTVIQFDNLPGKYLFEVKMSDSRNLTEVCRTVLVTLRNPDGTLPPNEPPAAHPQAVNVIPGADTPITLTGTDPEGHPLVFSVTSQPPHGRLSGVAPNLVYTAGISHLGLDSFTFQVMDTDGQTSSATVSITVSTAGARLLVHEPFDYPPGGLNGKGGTSEIGLTGTWGASSSASVVAGSLAYGSLPVTGGSIGNLNGGSNNYGGARAVGASALAANGLLDDGATLWFSVVMGYGTGANLTNSRLAFALANSGFNTGNYRYYINNEGSQLGSGLGVTLGRFDGVNGKVVASQFRDSSQGTSGWTGNIFGNVPISTIGAGQHRLVVGKITWGAESDTIELFEPDTNLNLNLPTSTLTVNVDQSKYDTLTWARGDIVTMDEIRFGDSLAAVAGLDLTPPDTVPPVLLSIADDRGGETMQQGESITYTLTFSEAMNAATIDADDFGNAGTAAIIIDPASRPLPHVVVVRITPTTPGTLQFRVPAGALLTDLAGNPLDTGSAITDGTIITVNPAMVSVPFVIGLSQAAAEAAIVAAELVVGTVTTQASDAVPAGHVLGQSPAGGTTAEPGSAVDLVVSLGDTPPPSIDGTWIVNAGGDWSNPDNWRDGVVASGTGATATIQMTTSGNRTITVDSARTIGHLTRNWPQNSVLTIGGSNNLTLADSHPTITNLDTANSRRVEITAPLAGADGLHLTGGGMVWLRSASTNYTGPTTVSGFLNFESIANANIGGGAAAGRNITVTAGSTVRFNALHNSLLNRLVETTDEIVVMSGTTGNALDFSSSAGANLPHAFLGNWAGNGAKMDYTGAITPAADHYRFGSANSDGLLTIASTLGGPQGVLIGGNRVQLSGTNTHTGSTFVRSGARLVLANPSAMQHSPLDTGTSTNTGLLSLSDGTGGGGNAGAGAQATPHPVLGGLTGSRHLTAVIHQGSATATTNGTAGNNTGTLALNSITGITLNVGADRSFTYTGAIGDLTGSSTAFALTKTGLGTQTLTGPNTYTGPTHVNQGTLALSGGSQASAITVAAGASLAFTLGSPTTSTSTVDLTHGTVRITGAVDNSTDYPLMAASGGITGTPALDEPIPGYELQLRQIGTELVLAYVGHPVSPYEAWSGGAVFDEDSNGDGVANGMAFLLGANNRDENASHRLPVVSEAGGALKLTFTCRNGSQRGSATLEVQYSRDLGVTDPWSKHEPAVVPGDAPVTTTGGGVNFVTSVMDADRNMVEATIPASAASPGTSMFARLKATP